MKKEERNAQEASKGGGVSTIVVGGRGFDQEKGNFCKRLKGESFYDACTRIGKDGRRRKRAKSGAPNPMTSKKGRKRKRDSGRKEKNLQQEERKH